MTTEFISGGVTAAKGFLAHGVTAGIKKSGKMDLALIYSKAPATAAGVFTTNKVQASCVVLNTEKIASGKGQAIIANSGNANCMTGEKGFGDSRRLTKSAAEALGISDELVYVASTGVIGHPLPIEKLAAALPELVKGLSEKGSTEAAKSIMTTDTVHKEAAVSLEIGGTRINIGAITKGGGMVHPKMALPHATMLCFATTDAAIESVALAKALESAVSNTFNMITVDGDTSTNDMVLILANGEAKNKPIQSGENYELFAGALEALFLDLAKQMIRDAEGATKFVEVEVRGAKSEKDARTVALSVAGSNLVKCALFGSDPNWGRIAAAAGYSGAEVDPWKLQISMQGELIVKDGGPVEIDQQKLDKLFSQKDIVVTVDVGLGKFGATAYTCDLTTDYVVFNSGYHT